MSLQKTIEVVAKLADRGAIKQYAITGAVAALNYVEPALTQHLDVLVSVGDFDEHKSGLIPLTPIASALRKMGYTKRSDVGSGSRIGRFNFYQSPRPWTKKL